MVDIPIAWLYHRILVDSHPEPHKLSEDMLHKWAEERLHRILVDMSPKLYRLTKDMSFQAGILDSMLDKRELVLSQYHFCGFCIVL
jgi:hypothetical protein